MDDYEIDDIENDVVNGDERGFLDKAMEKLKGPSKKKRFLRGILYGYGSSGYGFEILGRGLTKKEVKDADYFTPIPMIYDKEDKKSNLYKAGFGLGAFGGGISGFFTFGLSYAAPHIAGFANRIHRKIKKNKSNGRY